MTTHLSVLVDDLNIGSSIPWMRVDTLTVLVASETPLSACITASDQPSACWALRQTACRARLLHCLADRIAVSRLAACTADSLWVAVQVRFAQPVVIDAPVPAPYIRACRWCGEGQRQARIICGLAIY